MPAHIKRRRLNGPLGSFAPVVSIVSDTAPPPPRRTTRQSSNPRDPPPPAPEPPRRRLRRSEPDGDGQPADSSHPSRSPRGKENILTHPEHQLQRAQHAKATTRLTRNSTGQDAPASPRQSHTNIHPAEPPIDPAYAQTNPMATLDIQRQTVPSRTVPPATAPMGRHRSGSRPSALDPFIPHQQSVSLGRNKPIIMTTSVAQSNQSPLSKLTGTPEGAARGTDRAGRPDRNIDKVVLGDICFRAWYPSYYGKDVLGDISGNNTKGGKEAKSHGNSVGATLHNHHGAKDDAGDSKAHGRRDRDVPTPMLDRLCVCPCCFRYSKELVTWWEHVRWCERQNGVPGRKIYTHPKGRRTVLVPSGPVPKQGRGKRGSVGQKMVEEVVQDEGEWSIWEVDGEKDVLFCQNLSLFAKLFLDNKSVFFDVTGFNYFLLVYTPPTPTTDPDADVAEILKPRSQIVGFFSKEKMSWDNNNLACILIFPPWQRKGLGSLLMGISYEISRREGLLGGPEKPISDLGKRGYKRYWAGEIARWLLSLGPTSPEGGAEEEIVVDINRCSQATWIAPEDCLLVLREMGVAEDAGTGPPAAAVVAAAAAVRIPDPTTTALNSEQFHDAAHPHTINNVVHSCTMQTEIPPTTLNTVTAGAATVDPHQYHPVAPVQRVRISQAAVRAWVAANRISLERACDPDGFVEGYAIKASAAVSEASV